MCCKCAHSVRGECILLGGGGGGGGGGSSKINMTNRPSCAENLFVIVALHIPIPSLHPQEAFPCRLKGIHLLNQPWYISLIIATARPFLKQKFKERVSHLQILITHEV